ncbi:hypothetical protein F441_00421 [Phytophthora nicotianae CJ01A1]|uniref:Uncharacterized protein n=1 Tax=Phytophthora nicotianae CJ01A1 TaxID=1317063 RepID=W2XWV7_PHYNI|nr:hypothetical protein F441_00421 [Phytophthora nicotianae CJ01A1]
MPTSDKSPQGSKPRPVRLHDGFHEMQEGSVAPPPHMGKQAAYLALLERERVGAEEDAHAAGKPVPKAAQKRLDKELKDAQEIRAKARAAAAATKKKMAQMKERRRLEMEEKRGATARVASQERVGKAPPKAKEAKAPATLEATGKKKRRTCPHVAEEEDADSESISFSGDSPSVRRRVKPSADPISALETSSRPAARALDLDIPDDISIGGEAQEEEAAPAAADTGMTSKIEGGSSDSESWYVESRDDELCEELEEEAEDKAEDGESSDEGLDGAELIARGKKKTYQKLASQRLKAATEKLPRDWDDTLSEWPKLTKAEMAVLAQDSKALQILRGGGWELDPECFPVGGGYTNLSSGEQGPTDEVLAKADSPLDLFFFSCRGACGVGLLTRATGTMTNI